MRVSVCVIALLALATILPTASADPEEEPIASGELVEDTCYKVNPYTVPPVTIYQCPQSG